MLGGDTRRIGAEYEFSTLRFKEKNNIYQYIAKSRSIPGDKIKKYVSYIFQKDKVTEENITLLKQYINLTEDNNQKILFNPLSQNINHDINIIENIYRFGSYISFSSERSEIPYWSPEIAPKNLDYNNFFQNLNKPITVKSSLKDLLSWLMEKIIDSYVNPHLANGIYRNLLKNDPLERVDSALKRHRPIDDFNIILSKIFRENTNIQKLFSRHNKIAIFTHSDPQKASIKVPSLNSLSTGQAQLIGIFGTILHHADHYHSTPISMKDIEGIVVVDEIDAHLHNDYLYEILPELIQLFPKVQFIMTCHAPFLPLGMEKLFGKDGFSMIELPEGKFITSEHYSEFKAAFNSMEETKAFEKKLSEYHHKPHIFCEGPTDPRYLKKAAQIFNISDLLDENKIIIRHIGYIGKDKSPKGSGADSLKKAKDFFSHNPDLLHHPLLLLFDCDQKDKIKNRTQEKENLFIHSIKQNTENCLYKTGIENLFPLELSKKIKNTPKLKNKYYSSKTTGDEMKQNVTTTLDKTKLCDALCRDNDDDIKEEFGLTVEEIFANFKPLLMEINKIFFQKKEHDKS